MLKNYKHLIIIGTDQNIDLLKVNHHAKSSELLNLFFANKLSPCITKPTRITHKTATLIDNIYLSAPYKGPLQSGILVTDISDHFPIFIFCGHKTAMNAPKSTITSRSLTPDKIIAINDKLRITDWNTLKNLQVNDAYSHFINILQSIIDDIAPEKTKTFSDRNTIREPWMSPGLIRSSNKLQKLYRKQLKVSKEHEFHKHYVNYRNLYNTIKRSTKQNYYEQMLNQNKSNLKKTWQILNTLIGKCNDKTNVPQELLVENKLVNDPQEVADAFGEYFSKVGAQYSDTIPKSNIEPEHYCEQFNPNSLYLAPTDPNELQQIISKLKSKTSCGFDNISSKLLKDISPYLLNPLTILINKSMEEGKMPDDLKLAKVVPIHKSGNKQSLNNYRPISLLPVLSKLFEKVIFKRLYHFIDIHDMLYSSQYGFRPGHSTTDAITEFSQLIHDTFEKKEHGVGLFLDLSKAFDTIDHSILLKKLQWYGVRGKALEWFRSYLLNRKQFVRINNFDSALFSNQYGVPQGSVLGPLLFIIYINDLPNALLHSKPILFADDTSLYYSSKSINNLYTNVNDDLKKLNEWFMVNRLSLNISKTNYVHFTKLHMTHNHNQCIKLGNNIIKQKNHLKFLGLNIDAQLTWQQHIDGIRGKIRSAVYALNRVKNILPRKALVNLYHSLIQSHLNYGISLWGYSHSMYLQPIRILQKKAIRAVCRTRYNEHTNDLFKSLHILKFDDLYTLNIGTFMYKFSSGALPEKLQQLFSRNRDFHNYNTRNKNEPVLAIQRLSSTQKSIIYQGPKVWNQIPDNIKVSPSIQSFKKKFKGYLIK
jgi:hypothetical protein